MNRAFLDASVLYPASLRNLLMRLALNGLFQVAKLHRVRDLMDEYAEDCVVTGYESLIADLSLPDPNDRHVLAAAIVCQADMIVTRNLRDFPAKALSNHNLEAVHPDIFLRLLLGREPKQFLAALHDQQASLRKPPLPMNELLLLFERVGLPKTVEELRRLT